MKRIALLVIVINIMILAAACGGAAPAVTQAPEAQPPSAQPAAAEPSSANSPAAETPVAAVGTEVNITLRDNTIESSLTTFQTGQPYTFVITNKGNHAHNFNIAQPISVAGSLDAALQTALLAVPKNQLGSGAQVTVQYTFPDAAASTQLEFSCLIPRHYEDGMKLPITVTN